VEPQLAVSNELFIHWNELASQRVEQLRIFEDPLRPTLPEISQAIGVDRNEA